MNKKFTMMLAAFLAAGYTITAEAGVVKVSKPVDGKTYVIGANGIYVDASTSGTALAVTKTLNDASTWNTSINSKGIVAFEDETANVMITYNNGSKFLSYEGQHFDRISLLDENSNIYIQGSEDGKNFEYLKLSESATSAATTTSEATALSFFEVGKPYTEANGSAIIIGDKYLVLFDNGNLALVSKYDYFAMKTPTVWTSDAGKLKTGSNSYLKFDAEDNLAVGTSGDAAIFETANGKLTVTTGADLAVSKYVEVDLYGNITAKVAGTSEAPKNTIAADGIVAEDAPKAIEVIANNAVVGFPANSRLMVYNGTKFQYVVMGENSQVEVAEVGADATDNNAYWTMSGTKISNKAGGVFTVVDGSDAVQDFERYYTADPEYARSFYLKSKTGKFLKLNGTTITVVSSVSEASVFSAVSQAQTGMSAEELNDVNRGASFSLVYKFSDSNPADVNPFDKNMKAFAVEGYYNGFVLATKWPAKYNGKSDCKISVSELQSDDFTFLIATPNKEGWGIQKFDEIGEGVKFEEVDGDRLVNADAEDLKAGKHDISNGLYSIRQNDNSKDYVLSMSNLVYYNAEKEKWEGCGTMNIALVEDQNKNIVTTIASYNEEETDKIKFGAIISNTRTVKPSALLSTDKASVFNIKFVSKTLAGNKTGNEANTLSEYNKYLTINNYGTLAHGSNFVNLNSPESQWIVTDVEDGIYTFQNRENANITFSAELLSTDKENTYELISTSTLGDYAYVNADGEYVFSTSSQYSMNGMTVELTSVTPDAEAGYATSELDKAGLVRFMFNRTSEDNTSVSDFYVVEGENKELVADKEISKAAQFSIVKFDAASTATALSDSIYADNDYVVLKTAGKDDVETVEDGDSIKVVSYAFKQLRNDKKVYYLNEDFNLTEVTDESEAPRFIVKLYKNGSYGLIPVSSDYLRTNLNRSSELYGLNYYLHITKAEELYYNYSERLFDFNILKETPGTSYNHVPQHVTMEAVNGGYIAMNAENKEGIVAPVSTLKAEYTKEDLTFWLDTTDSEAVTPSFMISKAGNYMYNAVDSLNAYNDGNASAEKVAEFGMTVNGSDLSPKAIFQTADLTKVEDIENYKFQIVQSEDADDEYVIRSLNDYSYVAAHNQKLYFTAKAKEALKLVITPAEAPTSNEGVSATEVKVVAQNGSVVVKNAAGKNVVVSTILGQVVANEVLTSDNATINVPAGIVVVAVEGESFKVNVK